MGNRVICVLMVLAFGLNASAAYIGNPSAGNGWDSSSAITVTSSQIYGDGVNPNVYRLVDGSGMDTTGQLHSNIFNEMCYVQNTTPSTLDKYDPDIVATGKVWVAFEFNKVYSLSKMLVWNYCWYDTSLTPAEDKSIWGMKDVTIAYSVDKNSWTEFNYTLAKAPGGFAWNDGDPSKCAVTNEIYFGGSLAKYVVILAHSNYHTSTQPKHALSEVRFEIIESENPCVDLLEGDLDADCDVDFADLAIFTSQWLNSICASGDCVGDLDYDNDVDYGDYALLARNISQQAKYTLNTDDTKIEFNVYPANVFISSLANLTEGYNWIAWNTMITLPTTAWVGSTPYTLNWQMQNVVYQNGVDANSLTITFVNQTPSLQAKSIWTAHPGPGPVQHRIEIKNTSTQVVQVNWTPSLDLDLTLPQETVKHWWVEKGAGNPSDLGTNITTIGSTFDYTGICTPYDNSDELNNSVSNEPVPWQTIHTTTSSHGIYTGIESTACVMQKAKMNTTNNVLELTLGVDQTLSTFRTQLQIGETYEFPPIFIGCFKGDVDDGSNRLRRWVERWLLLDSDDANLPLLVNNSWGGGLAGATETGAMNMINQCNSLGIEMFHLDAGWYQNVGYWYYDSEFPRGLKYVSDYAHSKGIRFGLWCAYQLGGNLTGYGTSALSIYGTGMSGWFSSPGPEFAFNNYQWKFGSYNGAVACLSYQPPRDWILNDMRRCITNYGLDHLEHDRRVIAQTCTATHHGHLNNSGDISLRNARAYYQMLDTWKSEYPNIILENCVMGGRMLDYGLIQHTHYSCVNDDYDPMSLRQGFYDESYAMPARILEGYIGSSEVGTTVENLRYNLRSAMLGWCTIMMDTSVWNTTQWNDAKYQFGVYKQKIRPQIRNGNLYHITNRPTPTGIDAIEYYIPATGKGVVFVFRGSACSQSAKTLYLKGLEANSTYDISFEDGYGSLFSATGQYLKNNGVIVMLPSPATSELIYITRQ